MSNLRDLLQIEIQRGKLSEPFSVTEVRRLIRANRGLLGGTTPPRHLNAYLANHSTGPGSRVGEAVRRGAARLFVKHSKPGTYSLDLDDCDPEVGTAPPAPARPPARTARQARAARRGEPTTESGTIKDDIASRFVEYLRAKPFRLLLNTAAGQVWGAGPVVGWRNRLTAYEWGGNNWATTEGILSGFAARLIQLENEVGGGGNQQQIEADLETVYNDIRAWGNPRGTDRSGPELLALLTPLWASQPITRVDSTLTKLYALARPDEYVMYDSRVATAILTIAEDLCRTDDKIEVFRGEYGCLGFCNVESGTRPRGYRFKWRNAYRVCAAQLEANDLCRRIVARLNRPQPEDGAPWTLREVEAVLFMEGY